MPLMKCIHKNQQDPHPAFMDGAELQSSAQPNLSSSSSSFAYSKGVSQWSCKTRSEEKEIMVKILEQEKNNNYSSYDLFSKDSKKIEEMDMSGPFTVTLCSSSCWSWLLECYYSVSRVEVVPLFLWQKIQRFYFAIRLFLHYSTRVQMNRFLKATRWTYFS